MSFKNYLKKIGDGFIQSFKFFYDHTLASVHNNLRTFISSTENKLFDKAIFSAQISSVFKCRT